MHLKTGAPLVAESSTFYRTMPTPAHISDTFAMALAPSLPLFMTLSWIYLISMTVKSIVYEKEMRLKESMRIMGLSNGVHWLGWFITSATLVTPSVLIVTGLLCGGGVLKNSDPILIFIFIELFAFTSIALAFLISVFFSRAKIASACGGIIYFSLYVPYVVISLRFERLSTLAKGAACLMSTTAFGVGAHYTSEHELAGEGLQWSNLNENLSACDNFSAGHAMGMIIIDGLLYFAMAAYFEQVLPQAYGVSWPWHFVVTTPIAWYKRRRQQRQSLLDGQRSSAGAGDKGIEIIGLHKEYRSRRLCGLSREGAAWPAVDTLTLSLPFGEVTSLLGSNGAGKTTTMSVVTGLLPATRGTVRVAGLDIRAQMAEARELLGVCPQYNTLFDYLTVHEHVLFCARLRCSGAVDEALDEAKRLLKAVNLEGQEHVLSRNLSGGNKRKLSVALAFVGSPPCVILDEPTAGMDPSARRDTWDLILSQKGQRALMLSTHHLDEAELLSDRVAILHRGRLLAKGTADELRAQLQAEYTVIAHLKNGHRATRDVCQALETIVRGEVPTARIRQCGTEEDRAEEDTAAPAANVVRAEHGALEGDAEAAVGVAASRAAEGTATAGDVGPSTVAFALPRGTEEALPRLLAQLESAPPGIERTEVHALDLEGIFLRVLSEAADEDAAQDATARVRVRRSLTSPFRARLSKTSPRSPGKLNISSEDAEDSGDEDMLLPPDTEDGIAAVPATSSPSVMATAKDSLHEQPARLAGVALFLSRLRALLVKRWHCMRRDTKAAFSMLVLPVVFMCFAMLVAKALPPESSQPALLLRPETYAAACGTRAAETGVHNADGRWAANLIAAGLQHNAPHPVTVPPRPGNLSDWMLSHPEEWRDLILYTSSIEHQNDDAYEGFFFGTNFSATATPRQGQCIISIADPRGAPHLLPIALSSGNEAVLRSYAKGAQQLYINAYNHPLNTTADASLEEYIISGTDISVAIFVIFALSFIPASVLVFLVMERVSQVKRMRRGGASGRTGMKSRAGLAHSCSVHPTHCSIPSPGKTFAAGVRLPALSLLAEHLRLGHCVIHAVRLALLCGLCWL
jgi:ATP-binding cassette subfamily A (ABC1) protein 1